MGSRATLCDELSLDAGDPLLLEGRCGLDCERPLGAIVVYVLDDDGDSGPEGASAAVVTGGAATAVVMLFCFEKVSGRERRTSAI